MTTKTRSALYRFILRLALGLIFAVIAGVWGVIAGIKITGGFVEYVIYLVLMGCAAINAYASFKELMQ